MANDLSTSVAKKAKSFWDTKEGTTGMLFGMAGLGFLGWAAYKIMPYVANLMENTFYAIVFGALSVGLIYALVIDGTLRNRLWLMYKLAMRAMTYSIIAYDPIGVLREIQKKALERIKHIDECRIKVNGQVRQINEAMNSFFADQKKLVSEVTYYQKQNDPDKARMSSSKLGRLNEAIARLDVSLKRTQGFYTQLTRAQTAVEQIHENVDFEISLTEREYKATTAARDAWQAVREAFKGNTELDSLQQDTLAFLAEDYGNKLGEIDSFMTDSMKFIDGVDVQNAMYADEGMKMLDSLNSRQLDIVPAKVALPSSQQNVIIPLVNGAKQVDYAALRK